MSSIVTRLTAKRLKMSIFTPHLLLILACVAVGAFILPCVMRALVIISLTIGGLGCLIYLGVAYIIDNVVRVIKQREGTK